MKQVIFDFNEENYTVWHINVNDSSYKKLQAMGVVDKDGYMTAEDFLRLTEYAFNSSRKAKNRG